MENLNITSIYKLTKSDGTKTFFYTVKQQKPHSEYSYYLLDEKEDHTVTLSKVSHVIELLQSPSNVFSPLRQEDEDYDLFVTRLAKALKPEIHHENFFPKKYQKLPTLAKPQVKIYGKFRRKK